MITIIRHSQLLNVVFFFFPSLFLITIQEGGIINSVLQMSKLRLREVKELAKSHPGDKHIIRTLLICSFYFASFRYHIPGLQVTLTLTTPPKHQLFAKPSCFLSSLKFDSLNFKLPQFKNIENNIRHPCTCHPDLRGIADVKILSNLLRPFSFLKEIKHNR